MEQHLDLLRRGHPILKPVYNHNTGDFDPPEYIEPREFIIVEGLLGFHSRALRRNYDVKVYLAPEEELRIRWKLKRDTSKRGYTPAEVREALTKRGDDSPKFIQPQQTHADIIVNFHRPAHQAEETGAHLDVRLILRPTLPHPNLGELIECDENLKNPIVCVSIDRQGDWLVENVDISGRISDEKSAQIEALIWRRLTERYPSLDGLRPEQVGSFQDGAVINQSHPLALTQLLIAYHTLIARQDLDEELRKLAQR
jgi:phosphoribulokinase